MRTRTFFPVVLGLLAACGAGPAVTEEMAMSPGKPGNPISVELVASKAPESGGTTDAEVVVTSRIVLASLDVEVQPVEGVALSETHFSRRNGRLREGAPLRMPLKITATGNEGQRVTVQVRALTPEGNLITRDVELSLEGPGTFRKGRGVKTPRRPAESAAKVNETDEAADVIVPAGQVIRR